MAAGCVRWMLLHSVKTVCAGSRVWWTPASRFLTCRDRCNVLAAQWRCSPFCTASEDTEQVPASKKRKQDPRARVTINSIGRKIPHRQVQVISAAGENLGVMHRADVIRIMDEQDLKLVLLSAHKDPPVYRLMTGKQIHEEQMKMWEKQKAKAAPVQVKELTFSSDITPHDLSTKLKQVENWLEKKHHVRLTVRSGRAPPTDGLDVVMERMVEQMDVMVVFVSKPKVIRDGRASTCVLRPPSAKELSMKDKPSPSKPAPDRAPPAGGTDAVEETVQQ